MRETGLSMRTIAKKLGRSPNAISYELRHNQVSSAYDPGKAERKAYQRRRDAKYQGMKVSRHTDLRRYVDTHLYDDLSPEAIAGRVTRHEKHLPSISKNSIRRYIESSFGGKVAWHRIIQRKKRTWRKKRVKVIQLTDRTFIDKRPQYIQKRERVGDAEADFILSGNSGRGILLTLACRKIRVSFIEEILDITIPHVHLAFQRIKKRFPELMSISTDNDILLKKHKELEKLLGVKIYFCHPYHSWEKGTIENTNKYIRKDIPKGSDISPYSKRFIKKLEAKLNRRFMEVLNYRTPHEMLEAHRKQKKRRSAVRSQKK
ncbi:MAG: IS30 family transposase [Candidatus Sungbacteria bacterium]|nr:IS30 family transposase [Candidatus Sungbacteria bacterium]